MKYLIMAVICLGILSTGVHAMIETLNLDELVGRSEMVVAGKVTAIKPVPRTPETAAIYADLPEQLTFLDNEIEVAESHKGSLKAGDKLSIRTLSGFEDSTTFAADCTYLLFLVTREGQYEVVNTPQGCWPVEEDGKFGGMGFETTLDQVKAAIK
ncbi:MAG TPA: hypothetical protein PKN29_02490 [Candidatus Ozemobacteraceae bacterium]|nr:hypothetical protein [Candidatus Ozemobacteraceae bacterium]